MLDTPPTALLKVLTDEEKALKEKEARQEGRAKTVTKVIVRGVAFNFDVIALLFIITLSTIVGYTFARIAGLSAEDLKTELSDYIYLMFYIASVLASCVANLAAKRGLIAKALQDSIGAFFSEGVKSLLEPKSELKWNVLTSQSTEYDKNGSR